MNKKSISLIALILTLVCLAGCGTGSTNSNIYVEESSETISDEKQAEGDEKKILEESFENVENSVNNMLQDEMEGASEDAVISERKGMEQVEESPFEEHNDSIDYIEYENYKDWIYTRIEDVNSDDIKSISEERFKEIVLADMEKITEAHFSEVSMKRITEDGWYVITARSNESFSFNGETTNEVTYVSNIVLGETVDNSGYAFYLDLK